MDLIIVLSLRKTIKWDIKFGHMEVGIWTNEDCKFKVF
jgi:hypothetical protein